jgi:hypothetical protein
VRCWRDVAAVYPFLVAGDFLIVSTAESDYESSSGKTGKVQFYVQHVLFKDQIKHLQSQGKW